MYCLDLTRSETGSKCKCTTHTLCNAKMKKEKVKLKKEINEKQEKNE